MNYFLTLYPNSQSSNYLSAAYNKTEISREISE